MDKIKLGRTNLMVTRSGFGALPVQRVSFEDAKKILRKAYDSGINFLILQEDILIVKKK